MSERQFRLKIRVEKAVGFRVGVVELRDAVTGDQTVGSHRSDQIFHRLEIRFEVLALFAISPAGAARNGRSDEFVDHHRLSAIGTAFREAGAELLFRQHVCIRNGAVEVEIEFA